jgi:hypothetical protein
MTTTPPYRFGIVQDDNDSPHRYPGIWQLEETTGPPRLVLAPAGGYVQLLQGLATCMKESYGVLHVLTVSRCGRDPGRYETADWMTAPELSAFLASFAGYLEHDGRHHTWLFGGDGQQIVYDNHDLVYCYGDIDAFRAIAEASGLQRGEAEIPFPHKHMYNESFDADEQRIFDDREWLQFALQPSDTE